MHGENVVCVCVCTPPFPFARALTSPGYVADWHVGVRSCAKGTLLAFISGTPSKMNVWGVSRPMCQIDFLCVHKKLRSRRLAPVLIKEVTRRVNLRGVFQAVYTAGAVLPGVVSRVQYLHRAIHVRKLLDIGFIGLGPRQTVPRLEKLLRVPPVRVPPL